MSFTRLTYDKCAYAIELKQSVSPLDYQLYVGKFENKKPCPCNKEGNDLKKCNVALSTRADVENELYNLNRPGTLCPGKKYNPNDESNFKNTYHPPRLCQGHYFITPTGLAPINNNGLKKINTSVAPVESNNKK